MSTMPACEMCGAEIADGEALGAGRPKGGRPARYCSQACRQRAFRQRVAERPGPPPMPARDEASGGVPPALDGFVGRGRELTQLRSLLRSARLLTVLGPGGAGKTRLAAELASRLRRGRGDGVRFIELDSVSQADLVPHMVATALGVGERSGRSIMDAIVEALGDGRVLVVLDNCEHLVEASAELVDALLRRCPKLRILATSRESLRVPGEVVFRVGALSLPTSGPLNDRTALLRSDAVKLFIERARACEPRFELTADVGPVVAEICRRLDGLPLAIELAARRVGALPLGQILKGLDDQAAILSDGARTGPARHRDLAAAIEWSYRLLTPLEQAVFRRLSVLAGGFDLDGAAAVCVGTGVERDAVLRLLCGLEAKSLIIRVPGDTDQARFRQLNPIRAFALDRLVADDELNTARELAADWLALLATPVAGWLFRDDVAALPLRQEQENLLAAVQHSCGQPGERHQLLAVALARLWSAQGHLTAARILLAGLLKAERGSSALATAAKIACWHGDHAEGLQLALEAVAMERRREWPIGLAFALNSLAFARGCGENFTESVAAEREALEVVRRLGRPLDTARCQQNLAWLLLLVGELVEAEDLLASSLPVLRALAAPHWLPVALHTAGAVQLAKGDLQVAEMLFAEVLHKALAKSVEIPYALEGLAIVAAERDQAERALRLAAAADAARQRLEVESEAVWQRWRDRLGAATVRARGTLTPAKAEAAIAAGRLMHGQRLLAYALADPRSDSGDRSTATDVAVHLLTTRERRVAALVTDGMTNPEIAELLQVSTRTVTTHLTSIRRKLGVRSRAQIALWSSRQADHLPP